jgi:hypothetical protein
MKRVKAARVADYHPGNVGEIDKWEQYVSWLVDSQERLRRAVQKVGGITGLFSGG